MPNQIVLSWVARVARSSFSPTQAAAALAAVSLYRNPTTDPILGQLFGLSVADDTTTNDGTSATRTLTLNMFLTSDTTPAPPPFPCRPRTSTPPTLPYPLRRAVTLPGSFFVANGQTAIPTTSSNVPSVANGDSIQFLSQEGVFYTVASVTPTTINLTAPYTGVNGNTGASKEVAAPVTRAALFSTSELDTNGVATDPAIPAGPGARRVLVEYTDSQGNSNGVIVDLTGKRPAALTLAPGTIDIAQIDAMTVFATGAFGNSVGQITLVELSAALPVIPPNATPGTGIGAGQGDRTFFALTDQAQLLISRALAYLPPSYFALAQQGDGTSAPSTTELAGPLEQFLVTETAAPPPNPPLPPSTIPVPTALSGLFTRTLQLALKGVTVEPQAITFV